MPSDNLSVSFSAYYLDGSNRISIVSTSKGGEGIPANSSNLVYFKWHVPDIAGKTVYLSAMVNSVNTILETNTGDNTTAFQAIIEAPSNSQTPDTQYEARAPAGFSKVVPSSAGGSASWVLWTYANRSFSRTYYGIQLVASPVLTPDSSVLSNKYQNGHWYVRSGYGFSINTPFSISTVSGYLTPPTDAYSSAQRARAAFSEYLYDGNTSGNYCDLQLVSNIFQFVMNPNAQNKRIHFVPLWMPDGDYTVKTCIYDLWTPAGMISGAYLTSPLEISGSAYDDHYATGN